MTRKLAISLPDDVAARLDREPNVSAFIAEALRARMHAEQARAALTAAGLALTDAGRAQAAAALDDLHAGVSDELRVRAAELAGRIRGGRP